MNIDYNHAPAQNPQTMGGPSAAWPKLFPDGIPASILDVGCGIGTWLKAAINAGVIDVFGIDGVQIPPEQLLFPPNKFLCRDLTKPVDLGRRFDVVICLEVAEHIETNSSNILIETLTKHSDTVIFSAACVGQPGQHHVNCQWPHYWQQLFNKRGFVCEDNLRWQIWDDVRIERWYRQNIFVARSEVASAGHEPRIKAVVHPEMLSPILPEKETFENHVKQIENGRMGIMWYLKTPVFAFFEKLKRHLA